MDAGRLFGGILRDLAASGYDAEWDCIPASAVGAPHRRDRVFIVARSQADSSRSDSVSKRRDRTPVDPHREGQGVELRDEQVSEPRPMGETLPHTPTLGRGRRADDEGAQAAGGDGATAGGVADADKRRCEQREPIFGRLPELDPRSWWSTECRLGIPSHGVPAGLDCSGWECGVPRVIKGQRARVNRLRALGNAVVPAVAEHVGRLIMQAALWEGE